MHLTGLGRVESRRGHYELLDGVIIDAGDKAMRGAEFVGWLVHPSGEPQVVRLWSPRARAIFVQPDGQHRVTLTSATLRIDGAWSPVPQPTQQRGSSTAHRGSFVPHIPPDHPVTQSSPPPPVAPTGPAALEALPADGPTEPGVPLLLRKSAPANQGGPARPAPRPATAPPPLPSLGGPPRAPVHDATPHRAPAPVEARAEAPRKRPPPLPADAKLPPPSARPAPPPRTKIAPSLPPVPLAPKPGLSPRPPVHRVAPVPPPPPPPSVGSVDPVDSVDELAITQRRVPPAPSSVPIPLRRALG